MSILFEQDESKSKKGLAELYEDDYAQKAGIAPAPLSISDELKKEVIIHSSQEYKGS